MSQQNIRSMYIKALKALALGMFVAPFLNGFFGELWEAFREFARLVSMLLFWLAALATYPISIFFFAGLSVYSDVKREHAMKKAMEEFDR